MRAIEIVQYGGPEMLVLCERPEPTPGPKEVLIKVHAAGVNRPDVLQRKGMYPVPQGASDLPGLEVAGEIVGGDLAGAGFRLGDPVCALVSGGGYAEFCVAHIDQCLPIPAGLSYVEAASLPETFFTVWSNVFDRAGLKGGESLLVQGGTSGIGVAAIQIAAALGHHVFATAGNEEKRETCEKLGAKRAINYRTEDFVEIIKAETGGRGVDVILDMVGGDYVAREIECLADEGRLVFIAFLKGAKTQFDVSQVMRRRLTLTGSTLRPRDTDFKAAIAKKIEEKVWPLIEAGKVRPIIYDEFSLEAASDAHKVMEAGAHIGKLVLRVR